MVDINKYNEAPAVNSISIKNIGAKIIESAISGIVPTVCDAITAPHKTYQEGVTRTLLDVDLPSGNLTVNYTPGVYHHNHHSTKVAV